MCQFLAFFPSCFRLHLDEHDLTHFCRYLRVLSPSTTVQDFSNRRSLARLLRGGVNRPGHAHERRRSNSLGSRGKRESISMSRRSSGAPPPTRLSNFQRYIDGTVENVPKLVGGKVWLVSLCPLSPCCVFIETLLC